MIYLLLLFFLTVSCTQNFMSYIKFTPQEETLISPKDMLIEVGLIEKHNTITKSTPTNINYTTGKLQAKSPILAKSYQTLQVIENSTIDIKSMTKNRLVAMPYFSSPGIIYQADQSVPTQGKFKFIVGNTSGQVKIRLYTFDGILSAEEIWYIEVQKKEKLPN